MESPPHPHSDPLQALAEDELALVSLLLIQGRGYENAADLLGLEPGIARTRARAAISRLAAIPESPEGDRAIDYLLGEGSEDERRACTAALAADPEAGANARRIAAVLQPLARRPLPGLPGGEKAAARRQTSAGASAADEARAAVAPRVAAQPPRPTQPLARRRPPPLPLPPLPEPRRHRRRAGLALGAVVAAGVAVVIATAGGSSHRARSSASSHVVLKSVSGRGLAAGAIVRQRSGLLLLLQGRGMAPNHGDSYAVWLYNTPLDSRLLGFISPNVGTAGTFASGTTLPPDALRFHTLLVTLETAPRPARPGRTVLRGRLVLPGGR